jgi:hypothetical protein
LCIYFLKEIGGVVLASMNLGAIHISSKEERIILSIINRYERALA